MEDVTSEPTNHITLSLIALLSATTLGVVCGLLFAPKSGTKTRRQLHNMAVDAGERIDEWTDDAKGTVGQFVKQGKKLVGA